MVMRLLLKTEKDQNKLKQHKKTTFFFLRKGQIKPQTKAIARRKPTYRAVSSSKA